MKSCLLAAAAALAAFTIAPVAQAQASCEDLAAVVEAAEFDFEDVLGEEIDDDLYESTLVLSGARECTVSYDWDSAYLCIWETSDEASARRMVDTQLATLRACLNDAWDESAIADDHSDAWRFIAGSTFSLTFVDTDEELVFVTRADASKQGTPTIYEVELKLNYTWF